jgi:DNA polymerase III sliding clamp (beta) subunit (PCNA family)
MELLRIELQAGTSTVIKGAGMNKLIPLTSMIGLKHKENTLDLVATDMTNTILYEIKVEPDDKDFDVVVDADLFSKLISKITQDKIKLFVSDSELEIDADGTYKIPLIADESGNVKFPVPDIEKYEAKSNIKLLDVKNIFDINKPALAKTFEVPSLTGYYINDKTITSDSMTITFNDATILDEPVLLPAQLINLLVLNNQEDIKVYRDQNKLAFSTDNVVIYSEIMDGISDFPATEISAYLDTKFPSMCKIPKDILLAVIDRISLFIDPYDQNGITLNFAKSGSVIIQNKKVSGIETINFVGSENPTNFMCFADSEMLKTQVEAMNDEVVEIWYGDENALKIKSNGVTQILALLEDEE